MKRLSIVVTFNFLFFIYCVTIQMSEFLVKNARLNNANKMV